MFVDICSGLLLDYQCSFYLGVEGGIVEEM